MIGPHTAFENFIFRAFNITGRATRAEYWWVMLIMFVLIVLSIGFDLYTVITADVTNYSPFAYLTPVLVLATIVPQITLTIRRLHDAGRSGMWYFVTSVPIIGPVWLLVMLLAPSDPEHNKWGEPPQAPTPGRKRAKTDDPVFGKLEQKPAQGGDTAVIEREQPSDPRQGYATLLKINREPTPEERQAQRDQISDYYRTRVLGQT